MVSDSEDADHIDLQPVDQGIRKAVERQCSRVSRYGFSQDGELIQEVKRLLKFVGEIARCDERAFADIPIDGRNGVGLRLVAKADPHRLWRY